MLSIDSQTEVPNVPFILQKIMESELDFIELNIFWSCFEKSEVFNNTFCFQYATFFLVL